MIDKQVEEVAGMPNKRKRAVLEKQGLDIDTLMKHPEGRNILARLVYSPVFDKKFYREILEKLNPPAPITPARQEAINRLDSLGIEWREVPRKVPETETKKEPPLGAKGVHKVTGKPTEYIGNGEWKVVD